MSWWLSYGVTRAVSNMIGRYQGSGRRPDDDGYILPDERARQAARAQLVAMAGPEANQIEISVLSGVLKLTGIVSSVERKQRAQEICAALAGVSKVENELVVG